MLVYTPTFLALQMAALTLLRARIDTECDPDASVKLLSRHRVHKLEYLRTTPSFQIAAHCNHKPEGMCRMIFYARVFNYYFKAALLFFRASQKLQVNYTAKPGGLMWQISMQESITIFTQVHRSAKGDQYKVHAVHNLIAERNSEFE